MSRNSDESVASAMALFSLPAEYTPGALDSAFRRLSLRFHPDRGGRRDLFETVCDCHAMLREHAEDTGMWARLRDVGREYGRELSARRAEAEPGGAAPAAGSAFNAAEFNRLYEGSRRRVEERDAGYAAWMSRAAAEFEEPSAPAVGPKAGPAAFNSAFERRTPPLDPESGAIVLRPAYASAGGVQGALFDETEEVSDFTTELGGGVLGADCRLAHGRQRLASSDWGRPERLCDRGSVGRLSAERAAEAERWAAVAGGRSEGGRGGLRASMSELMRR